VYKGLLSTFLAPPSSQRPDMPLPPNGAVSAFSPTFCVRWLSYIPYTQSRLEGNIRTIVGCPRHVASFAPTEPFHYRVYESPAEADCCQSTLGPH